MAGPLDFTGKNIEDTYQRIVQVSGSGFCDGTGSAISIGGSQNLQQVTDQGSVTTTPITASIISASSYEGFGTDLQIASASNISNLYITEFRETGSSFSNTGQPEIGSVLVLDISGSGDGNESVLRRMDFQAFNKAFYASASLSTLLELSASIASGAAAGLYSNGVFYQNGLEFDLDQNGGVGVNDLLLLLSAFGNTLEGQPPTGGSPTINKEQLRGINATHEGEGETQFMSGSFLITTASLSGSLKPSTTVLRPGTLKVDSHITSSGNIKANGLIVSGNINTTGTTTANDYDVSSGKGIGLSNNYSGLTFTDAGTTSLGFGSSWGLELKKDEGVVLYDLAHLSPSLYKDFRIEGNSDTHLFFITGGDARIGIGTSTPNEKLTVAGNISASGELIGIIDGGTF